MYIYTSYLCLLRGPRSSDTLIAASTCCAQILIFKYYSQKEPGLLGEVYDSRTGAGKIQGDPGTLAVLESKEVL